MTADGTKVVWHSGWNAGWRAIFFAAPSVQGAVVVLTNGNSSTAYEAVETLACDWAALVLDASC